MVAKLIVFVFLFVGQANFRIALRYRTNGYYYYLKIVLHSKSSDKKTLF
jgi:hypothetical protein